ncbi:hypothetical protein LOF28_34705, partial [Sinorhizobium meliloti]|nr:hypothetical protein [Sinorhizobium meliloti]
MRLLSAVASRAVSATFNVVAAGAKMQPGQIFSLGERLYRLRTVTWTSATVAAVTFRPPAREAAVAGQRVELDDPVCRMRLPPMPKWTCRWTMAAGHSPPSISSRMFDVVVFQRRPDRGNERRRCALRLAGRDGVPIGNDTVWNGNTELIAGGRKWLPMYGYGIVDGLSMPTSAVSESITLQ